MQQSDSLKIKALLEKIDQAHNPIDAYNYSNEIEKLALKEQDDYQLATTQLLLTQILIKNGIYKEALVKNTKALNYFRDSTYYQQLADCWKYMALIYGFFEDYDKQLEYNNRCLEVIRKTGQPLIEIRILNNIGHTHYDVKAYDKAVEVFKDNISNPAIDTHLKCVSHKNLGKAYYELGDYKLAQEEFYTAIELGEAYNLPMNIAASHYFLGKIYIHQQKFEKAKKYLETAVNMIDSVNVFAKESIRVYEDYIDLLVQIGDVKELKIQFKRYREVSKKINTQLRDRSIKRLQFQFEINEIEKERSKLEQENLTLHLANRKIEFQKEALESKSAELLVANKELKAFAHMVSHDLKQPIRNVSIFSNLLKDEMEGQLSENAQEYIGFMESATKEMTTFIDDIMRFAKVDYNKNKEKETVDCNKILLQVKSNLSTQIAESNTTIICKPLPTIRAHRSLMIQIFQNLISNAIKFRQEGITPQIKISSHENTTHWVFEIEDNGIGIKEEHQQKIFQLFTRLHSKQAFEGTGIGLSTVSKVITKYGGTIKVNSTYGKGSKFIFDIKK